MEFLSIVIALLFFIVGILGTFLPLLPGAPLIFVGMLIYGILTGFESLGWKFFILQGLIVVVIQIVDYISGVWGVKRYGGSKNAAWGSIVGGILGIFLFGPLGIILGPFFGALLFEYVKFKDLEKAIKVGWGTIVGFLGGTFLKLVMELVMIVSFFIQIYA